MDRKGRLLFTSMALGLISIAVAILGGIHLQHFMEDGGVRHIGETLFLIVLALGLFMGAVWTCKQKREE
jgi:hypothetical protein